MSANWYQTANRFRDPRGARRIAQFIDVLSRFPPGRLLDLGAGHGIFSRVAADMGWEVTAVDVRAERFPDVTGIRWVVSDIRTFDEYDDIDVVACLGLWYHLTLEDQLGLAAKAAPRPLILDTHVALRKQAPQHERRTGPIITRDGYTGRLYDESDLQDRSTASWQNLASFWPSVVSLEKQMYSVGYDVFEQLGPAYLPDRGYFLARSLGDATARAELDRRVSAFDPLVDPDAAPSLGPLPTLAPELAPVAEPTKATAPVAKAATPMTPTTLPIRVAARQFARAAQASGRRKVRQTQKLVRDAKK